MIGRPDADGKYQLSGREYFAIREIFGLISALAYNGDELKARAQLIPGVWRDFRMVQAKITSVVDAMLRTVPIKKIRMIKEDCANTVINVEVRAPHGAKPPVPPDYVCVPSTALDDIIGRVLNVECFACDKAGKAMTRCPVRAAIDDLFPFEIEDPDNGGCKYCGYHISHDYNGHEEEDNNNAESE